MFDALSSIFELLDLESARCTRLEAAGDWSLRFPEKRAIKFAAVIRGGCWMIHPDHQPIRMEAGDVFLLSQTPAYVLASDPALPPVDGAAVIDWNASDIGHWGGDEVVLLGGAFKVSALHEHLLTDALPHLMHIPRDAPSASGLRRTLEMLEVEFSHSDMGSQLLRHHLADMLLVQMLRAFSRREDLGGKEVRDSRRNDWLGALTDPRLARALNAIHAEPQHRWTLKGLALVSGMSRTSFAEAFRAAIGHPPMEYVLRWRMQLAEDRIQRGEAIAGVAAELGYASQSAFGVAFKRLKGYSPKAASRRAAEMSEVRLY